MVTITEFEPAAATLLLDEESQLTLKFESILKTVFLRYSSPSPSTSTTTTITSTEEPFNIFSNSQSLSREDLNQFSLATNGEPMTDETFSEISEYLDMLEEDAEEGQERFTFKGFLQLYQLQTESDEEETWKDLTKWGYSRELELLEPVVEESSKEVEVEKEKAVEVEK